VISWAGIEPAATIPIGPPFGAASGPPVAGRSV